MGPKNVKFVRGDMFLSKMEVLTVPVNTVGAMGAGLALAFAKKYPQLNEFYRELCALRQLRTGAPMLWVSPDFPRDGSPVPKVLLFPTKSDWRKPSQLNWIESGLDHLYRNQQFWNLRSLAVPALGCGLGELSWKEVRPVLEEGLGRLNIPVEVYEPS